MIFKKSIMNVIYCFAKLNNFLIFRIQDLGVLRSCCLSPRVVQKRAVV